MKSKLFNYCKLLLVFFVCILTITGCGKKEDFFDISNIYHFEESFQDTLYITYDTSYDVKEIRLITKSGNEYIDTFNIFVDLDINKYIKEKCLMFYIGKEDYKNKQFKLVIETENNKVEKELDLNNTINYNSFEDFKEKYNN